MMAVHALEADPDVVLRRATARDSDGLKALIQTSFSVLAPAEYGPEQIRSALQHGMTLDPNLVRDGTMTAALAGDRLVGCAAWAPEGPLTGHHAPISSPVSLPTSPPGSPSALAGEAGVAVVRSVFVHPDFIGRGLGRRLIERVEAEARTAGFGSFQLLSTLSAVQVYLKCGYRAIVEIPVIFPDGVQAPFVIMRKDTGAHS